MKPAAFEYHAPESLDEALGMLADLDDAKVLAGGQSLVPLLNMRFAVFEHLIDLRKVDELRDIEHGDSSLRLGACVTQTGAERDSRIAAAVPLLAKAIPHIGHFQIRNRGTIGGSLAHADPAAEIPAVALTLDARVEAASVRGRRSIPAEDFFTGTWTTALDDDEIVIAVEFPQWSGTCGYAVEEIARRQGDFALAGACAAVSLDGDTIERCAIGLLGLGSTPERARGVEASLAGSSVRKVDVAELGRAAVADLDAIPSDLHGPEWYRARVGATVIARAWESAVEEAMNG